MNIMKNLMPRLLEARPGRWEAIAKETGLSLSAIRKIVYKEVLDPGVLTVQRLLDYFEAIDAGRKQLPPLPPYKPRVRRKKAPPAETSQSASA